MENKIINNYELRMKRTQILIILFSVLLLGGCGLSSPKTIDNTAVTVEQGVVTRTGQLKTKVGSEYLLSTTEGIINITSNKVNLDQHLGKKITVTGMFSGSTLYVDKLAAN